MIGDSVQSSRQKMQTSFVGNGEWPARKLPTFDDIYDGYEVRQAFERLSEAEQEACQRNIFLMEMSLMNPFEMLWFMLTTTSGPIGSALGYNR